MTMNRKYIPVRQYVQRLEKFCIEFFKKCEEQTNQFSTRFILQKAISEYRQWMQDLSEKVNSLGEDPVYINDLDRMLDTFSRQNLDQNQDVDNLNFVEATNLAMVIMEFVITKYKELIGSEISERSRLIISEIIAEKQKHLCLLKSEYEKVRYK